MDWFPYFVGFLGLAIGWVIQEYRIRREREDKYKYMVFEKRMDAHQEAYYRLGKLMQFMLPARLKKEAGVSNLSKELSNCFDFMTRNALYLAKDTRRDIMMFLEYARKKGKKYLDAEWVKRVNVGEETEELIRNTSAVLASVEKGVGVKYLPKERKRFESSYLQQVLDEAVAGQERVERKEKK